MRRFSLSLPIALMCGVAAVVAFAGTGFAEDDIPKGDMIPPPAQTDSPRDLVVEMMDGRTVVGKFDPVRRIINTSGAIKAEIYIRDKDVKAWYLAVDTSAKSLTGPTAEAAAGEVNAKPILPWDDAAWIAKVPPYRLNSMAYKEAGEYQKRFTLVPLDASMLESWDCGRKGYTNDNPLVLLDGKEENIWSFGYPRNSVKFVLNEPVPVSMIGIRGNDQYTFNVVKSLSIEVNDGTKVEASEPKTVWTNGAVLYLTLKKPAQVKSVKILNLNGGDNTSFGFTQLYFLRDKKLDKMLENK